MTPDITGVTVPGCVARLPQPCGEMARLDLSVTAGMVQGQEAREARRSSLVVVTETQPLLEGAQYTQRYLPIGVLFSCYNSSPDYLHAQNVTKRVTQTQ